MPESDHLRGLLDLSKIKEADYAPLPKSLASAARVGNVKEDQPLFAQGLEFADVHPLLTATPPDPALYNSLSSLLNGLSSGPALIMGLFRAGPGMQVVIRLYKPERPVYPPKPQPLYFRLERGHAEVARRLKWVGPKAPDWLALLAAVYYSYIGDRVAFYKRPELGGAGNAAYLTLFAKDTSAANYKDADKAAAAEGGKADGGKADGGKADGGKADGGKAGSAKRAAEILLATLGREDDELSAEYVQKRILAGCPRERIKALSAEWLKWATQVAKVNPNGLPEELKKPGGLKLEEFRKWCARKAKASPELLSWLELYLEANQAVSGGREFRYPEGVRELIAGIEKEAKRQTPMALALRPRDPLLQMVPDAAQAGVVPIVGKQSLELPHAAKERALDYLVLPVPKVHGRRYRWSSVDESQQLVYERDGKPEYWLEISEALKRADLFYVGEEAEFVLPRPRFKNNFIISLKGNQITKVRWPASAR